MTTHDMAGGSLQAGRGYGRLLDVLGLVAQAPEGLTTSDIVRRLALPKSSAFVLLQYLASRGIVSLDPRTRRYTPGPELVALAYRVVGGLEIARVARPHLERLSRETGEDAYLGILQGTHFIYVDRVDGVQSVQLNLRLGVPRPLHCTAPGKLFLAFESEDLLKRVVAEVGLPAMTPASITNPRRLAAELARIRARGYSVSDAEHIEGIFAVAAPVRDHTGAVVAALNIATQRSRGHANRAQLVGAILRAARDVSAALGAEV